MKEEEVEVMGIEEAKRVVGRLLEKEITKTIHLRSKWSLIATQLALLHSNLNLLGLPSIAGTLTLSHSFQYPSLPHGKLLSQSLALSSLCLHVCDSSLLLDIGLLSPHSSSSYSSPRVSSPSSLITPPTLAAISRISPIDSGKHALDAEGLPLLAGDLRHRHVQHSSFCYPCAEDSIQCLCNLVRYDNILKLELVQGRVIPRLKNYWESVPSDASLQAAAEFLSELASCQPIGEAILADGFLEKLMAVLSSEVSGVRIATAVAIHRLSQCMKSTEETEGGGGGIPALIGMLDGKSGAEREAAAMALSSLVVNKGNRRVFCRDSRGGVTRTVGLLDPTGEKLDRRYPVSVLASVVNNKKCRKMMVTAGACAYLEKLAGMDVEGAKKLYETILTRGKVWGILPHQGQS